METSIGDAEASGMGPLIPLTCAEATDERAGVILSPPLRSRVNSA